MGHPVMNSQSNSTLISAIWPETQNKVLRYGAIALISTLMLTASAKIQVPFWPVPMTMQTFVVLFLGAALGSRLGAAVVALYLLQGAMGFPVFAGTPEKGLGLAYMMGPTGGYLVGFVVGAYVTGWLTERGWQSVPSLFASMLIGHAAIIGLGYLWLAYLVGADKAWMLGVVPFLVGTLFKSALGAAALPALSQLTKR